MLAAGLLRLCKFLLSEVGAREKEGGPDLQNWRGGGNHKQQFIALVLI